MYVGKYLFWHEQLIKLSKGTGTVWRSIHGHSPAPLALLGQWWRDWMRWRWEGRDLPSLDERSPLLPRSSPHTASGELPPLGRRGQVMVGVYSREMLVMSRARGGFETKWKGNKIQQQDGCASTSLVNSPCLSLVGLWHNVDVLHTVGLPVDELQCPQHSCCWPLTLTWCAWQKLEGQKSSLKPVEN